MDGNPQMGDPLVRELKRLRKENAELKRDLALGLIGQGMITSNMNIQSTCEAIVKDIVGKVRCDCARIFRVVNNGDGTKAMKGEIGTEREGRVFSIQDYPSEIDKSTGRISPWVALSGGVMHLKTEGGNMHLYGLEITPQGQIIRKEVPVPADIMEKMVNNAKKSGVWEKIELPIFEKKFDDINGQDRKEVIGVLVADNAMSRRPISDSKIFVLSKAAQFAGIQLRNAELYERLGREAVFDPLTGLMNRRYLEKTLRSEILRSIRYLHPISLLMMDVDHFKQINDELGHSEGDKVLRAVAAEMRAAFRGDIDVVSRYGGEEFLVVLPETDLEAAARVAENIRKKIANRQLALMKGEQKVAINVTISIGVAELSGVMDWLGRSRSMESQSLYLAYNDHVAHSKSGKREISKALSSGCENLIGAMITAADRALYDAKGRYGPQGSGRNCVKVFDPTRDYAEGGLRSRRCRRESCSRQSFLIDLLGS